jgi:hypothetical protein
MGSLQSLTSGSVVEEVLQGDEPVAWQELEEFLETNSKSHTEYYKCRLQLRRVFRVNQTDKFRNFAGKSSSLGQPTRLFHGTSHAAAHAIAQDGFQLPNHSGMYGKGVYFAKCPLKSANYAWDFLSWISSLVTKTRSCEMLVCDVYLGKTLTKRLSHSNFDPDKDLQACAISKFFGLSDYNSVHAQASFLFSAVSVDEYVIYNVEQAVPRYLLKLDVLPA